MVYTQRRTTTSGEMISFITPLVLVCSPEALALFLCLSFNEEMLLSPDKNTASLFFFCHAKPCPWPQPLSPQRTPIWICIFQPVKKRIRLGGFSRCFCEISGLGSKRASCTGRLTQNVNRSIIQCTLCLLIGC